MPKSFDKCVREKGRIRRVSGHSKRWKVKKGEYRNICWDKKNVPHLGELHKKKTKKLITPSDIPKLLKVGMKVINPMKKLNKKKHKKKKVKKDILKSITKSLNKITDRNLIIAHYYLHKLWRNKNIKKMVVKDIVVSHMYIKNELKNRKLKHYKRDTLDLD